LRLFYLLGETALISVPPKGDSDKRVGSHFAPLFVEAQVAPDLTVKIRAGSFWTALAEHVEYAGGNSPAISPPTADAKWVVIAMRENGSINVINGAAGTSPDLPAIPETQIPLAGIFIGDTATEITSDMVFDIRPLWQVRAENVADLQGELDARPTLVDVNALLALKADIGGTPETVFTLNQDQVGGPGSDVDLEVERGANPNVAIRWNESSEKWEFTNDGVSYADIGAAAGSFYTQTELDGGVLDFRYYTKTQLDAGSLDTLYYTQAAADALLLGKTDVGHTHSYLDIPDFATGVAATAGSVYAPVVHLHVAADITDFVAEAQAANAGLFATVAHTHVAADTTDFATEVDARIALAEVGDLADISTTAYSDREVLVYNSTGSVFTNRLLVTDDLDDVDTTTAALAVNQALLWDGVNQFINRAILKSDVSDFVEADYVHVTGDETIGGEKTFTGDVIMQGTVVDIEATDLRVTDNYIDINFGEAGAGVTAGDGGIRIDRGTLDDALIEWDETTDQWLIGVVGSTLPILTGAHSHVVSHITDFAPGVTAELNVNAIDEMLDVVSAGHVLNDFLLSDGVNFNATSFSAAVTTELGLNQVEDLGDVNAYAGLAAQDALLWDGAGWQNRPVVKADVSDFVEADYVHVTGNEVIAGIKTFSDNAIFNGDLTVNGTTTTIDTVDLVVQDNLIVINDGEAGPGVGGGAGSAGIQVDRGAAPPPVGGFATDALLIWDETNLQWQAGVIGNTTALSLAGHVHVQADISDVSASAAEVSFLAGRALGLNLTFNAGGEVLGLPPTPSGATAAVSDAFLQAELALQDELAEMIDVDVDGAGTSPSLANQDALMYNLGTTRWQNRPFVEADISDLGTTIVLDSDIGSTVQAWDVDLDELAAISPAAGDMIVDVAGTWTALTTTAFGRGFLAETDAASTRTTLDLYSATELDAGQLDNRYYTETELDGSAGSAGAKVDKVAAATLDNVTTMLANGNVQDSGTALADVALSADHYTKVENDAAAGSAGAKINKVSGATLDNVTTMLASGEVQDSGIAMADVLTDITTGEIAHTIGNLGDVTDASSTGDFLVKTAGDWQNTAPAAISAFVRTAGSIAEAISGVKTFSDDVVIAGDLTVSGTTTTINTANLEVEDDIILVNRGAASSPVGGSGLEVERGASPNARWLWDDSGSIGLNTTALRWVGGVAGSEVAFAVEGSTVAQPNYELFVGTGAGLPTYVAAASVTAPAAGKAGIQVFVNGIKQIEGAAKAYTVGGYAPVTITFTAGNEPAVSDDVEIYSFGTIG